MDEGRPGPLAPPPDGLAQVSLPLIELAGPWFRTHSVSRRPYHYGRDIRHRFDDPEGKFGVLYVAADRHGAFIETYGQLAAMAEFPRTVTSHELSIKVLSEFRSETPLRLADLTGSGLARLGADSRIFAGDHGQARAWSRAIYAHPDKVDGIYYPVRHDPSRRAAAIFNESVTWIDDSRKIWLSLESTLREILNDYGFALIDGHQAPAATRKGPRQESLF